ncbi:Holliday junction branch migration protein RuvA [Coraliomargarita sp. SDUM461003]|uniref:Holliday junction branch migration complex subunit RuvA n=1 Tax=Thalassobacterium maritimum TaxID=3041265 RepID=A0ABU1ATD5_9BACT|nr:Holliday junction branch migration protein RuvA [Coraliomargarita sp. SDUM461003]MBT64473.1 Holliday junction branch migration protein RuvA [Puniceicoccaceae bacterium]MDQ8206405.1 Holliday junction branch migration protein RuvA [Coraliomargarita sp. SDUM461003]HBR93668.1 Holliday junction branch migration protein RuvA [Opitutae bacterium]|tara:strand:+ start:24106 stop:24705 length:600 start_codon:yes stop_codon:yes gene_type:complete
MIARLKGTVLESTPLLVVLEAGGVGYEVHIPVTTAEKVPAIGKECSLFIHSVYREDSATLYGFATRDDRDFYRLLIEKVSGIGPKIGISMLSRMSTDLLRSAIASADVALLSKCPGIGKKTAERLVIELKDKVGLVASNNSPAAGELSAAAEPSAFQDAVGSLMTLGYKPADADKLVRKAVSKLDANASTEALVKEALR